MKKFTDFIAEAEEGANYSQSYAAKVELAKRKQLQNFKSGKERIQQQKDDYDDYLERKKAEEEDKKRIDKIVKDTTAKVKEKYGITDEDDD